MRRRIIYGTILIVAILGLMWLDEALTSIPAPAWAKTISDDQGHWMPGVILLGLGVLACGRAGFELARMFRAAGIAVSNKSLTFSAMAGVLAGGVTIGWDAPFAGKMGGTILASFAGVVLFLSMAAYIRHKDVKGACGAVAAAVLSFVYAGVLLGFLLALRREFSVGTMLAVIFTTKACDSGAYFTGTAIGRHKLIPWLSPGKTWEGLFGGLVTSAVFGAVFALLAQQNHTLPMLPNLNWVHGAVLGGLLGLFGQMGDLSASVLKRDAGLKDAGRILPAFGGLIDMLDSLLIAAPVGFWYLAALRTA